MHGDLDRARRARSPPTSRAGDHVLVMSNGGFGGIHEKLLRALESAREAAWTQASWTNDTLGAFCRHTHVALRGAGAGPLAGLTFGAKDIYDVAGHQHRLRQPRLAAHASRRRRAPRRSCSSCSTPARDLVGKTHTDELTFSLNGENAHYGTPVNVNAPGRIPGGSSSGSAAAVAGGLVDFALGSDTGGSVRAPASFCGIYGLRPTHGRISLEGACPLAASFDTAGWFARDAEVMERVGAVLFGEEPDDTMPRACCSSRRTRSSSPGPAASAALKRGARPRDRAARQARARDGERRRPARSGSKSFACSRASKSGRSTARGCEEAKPALGPGIRQRMRVGFDDTGARRGAGAREARSDRAAHDRRCSGPTRCSRCRPCPTSRRCADADPKATEDFRAPRAHAALHRRARAAAADQSAARQAERLPDRPVADRAAGQRHDAARDRAGWWQAGNPATSLASACACATAQCTRH